MTSYVSTIDISEADEQGRHSACRVLRGLARPAAKNIANHAAQVPDEISDVPTALASREMHSGDARDEADVVTRQPEPGAEVHVLVVQVVARVESTDCGKGVLSEQHEHAAHPIRRDAFLADLVVPFGLGPQRLANQAG